MKYELYTRTNETIGIFEGNSIIMTNSEKDNDNHIESIHGSLIDPELLHIQLNKKPQAITRSIRNDIWIGEPSCFSKNEYEILWPKLNEVEQVTTELAQVYDDFI